MLCARIVHRARGIVSALVAPVPQANVSGLRNFSNDRSDVKLGDVLEALVKASTPSHEDRVKRLRVIRELQQSLGKAHLGPTIDLRILPFGSFVNSLYEANSDLDLAIVGHIIGTDDLSPDDKRFPFIKLQLAKLPREYATELLRTAVARFVRDGLVDERSMVPVLHARVPIIKFVHPGTGIHVDVCVGSEGDAFKTWSLAQLMALHPAVDKLCRAVKIWAKAQGINDPRSFTFNSWCLNLLVVFFLQRHSTPELLPPLKALIYDYVSHPGALVRLMHRGRQPTNKRIMRLMQWVTKNVGPARVTYGRRPAKPLDALFLDFLESNATLLRAALDNREPLTRGNGISVFHGDFHRESHFKDHVLFVEDPLNDVDNSARTLRVPKDAGGRTIDYVAKAFAMSAARLRGHLQPASAASVPRDAAPAATSEGNAPPVIAALEAALAAPAASAPSAPFSTASVDAAAAAAPKPASVDTSAAATSAPAASSVSPAASSSSTSSAAAPVQCPPSPPSLASTAVFLFGTELLSRLPDLSEQLLGPELCQLARGELAAGRPAGLVHEELLKKLGAAQGFEPFVTFKKRCQLKVLDEEEHWTPEELDQLISMQAKKKARLEKAAEAKARERARRAEKRRRRQVYERLRKEEHPQPRAQWQSSAGKPQAAEEAAAGGRTVQAPAASAAEGKARHRARPPRSVTSNGGSRSASGEGDTECSKAAVVSATAAG